MKKQFGKSIIINLSDCNDKINNPKEIKKFVNCLINEIKMKKQGPLYLDKFGKGKLKGYSFMQFIKTSSITGHFDSKKEKTNRAFIDIFSCKEFDVKKASKFCKSFFEAKKCRTKIVIRK